MKQIITRVDDGLAGTLKDQAARMGLSVNTYVTDLLRLAVVGEPTFRHLWKAGAIADGRLARRGERPRRPYPLGILIGPDFARRRRDGAGKVVAAQRDAEERSR